MLAWLLPLLGPLGDFLIKFWKSRGPDPVVVEAEKVGAAESALATEKATNAEITRAAAAGDAVGPVLDDTDKLRQYEARDPNNRDNG